MFALIKAIPLMMKSAKFWIIAALVSSLVSGVVWVAYDYRKTLQELAISEQRVDNLQSQLSVVNERIKKERDRTQSLRSDNSKITSQYLSKIRELQELKENYQMLKDKPNEAALKIESSFNTFMNDMSCITGETSQCPK
jgi:septal ring factor EnvC (AmiA/AmiB activator)